MSRQIYKTGRYSKYIRPLSYLIDLLVINVVGLVLFMDPREYFTFVAFTNISWIILSLKTDFYEVYRNTRVVKIVSLLILQAVLFSLITFAFFGFFNKLQRTPDWIFKYLLLVFVLITMAKFAVFYLLKRYRKILGGNLRNTIIIGDNVKTRQLKDFFEKNPEFGLQLKNFFKIDKKSNLEECFSYISKNEIDEIYCSIGELTNKQIKTIVAYADNNLKKLKFLPDNKEIFTKRMDFEYYGYLPMLSLRKIPLEESINQFTKRLFDIIMSVSVIIFLLSWLTPIIALLIRLESKGTTFFKQKRNGIDNREFYCYKFRSMRTNVQANLHQATRGDSRVTKIGKFIRKTSIDELPQFINVLKGDMSVVGPRPHMVSHTNMYANKIDKFMVRHWVKPGITGLAQVSGFRGEVETDKDIINRVKYDIFYVENWSILLDVKIVILTAVNAIMGEDKAY